MTKTARPPQAALETSFRQAMIAFDTSVYRQQTQALGSAFTLHSAFLHSATSLWFSIAFLISSAYFSLF